MPEERRERFEALYSSTRARILAYALRRVPSEQDAADILAETFTVAWRRFDEVPDGDEAILWLYGVARNVLRNYQRSRQRQSRLVEDIAHQVSEARWSVLPRDEDRLVALFCLRALEEEDREVLMLTSWEGLSP
jgi:RNA polymerase sigma-70 factor (ECF subfamily)